MSRQLIAGERAPRQGRMVDAPRIALREPLRVDGVTTYVSAEAAVEAVERMIEELRERESNRIEVERQRYVLQRRLADPELYGHPKRPEAERRYTRLTGELNEARFLIESLMLVIGDVYVALPWEHRGALGWPPMGDRYAVRAWLESCLAVGWLPSNEPPF